MIDNQNVSLGGPAPGLNHEAVGRLGTAFRGAAAVGVRVDLFPEAISWVEGGVAPTAALGNLRPLPQRLEVGIILAEESLLRELLRQTRPAEVVSPPLYQYRRNVATEKPLGYRDILFDELLLKVNRGGRDDDYSLFCLAQARAGMR